MPSGREPTTRTVNHAKIVTKVPMSITNHATMKAGTARIMRKIADALRGTPGSSMFSCTGDADDSPNGGYESYSNPTYVYVREAKVRYCSCSFRRSALRLPVNATMTHWMTATTCMTELHTCSSTTSGSAKMSRNNTEIRLRDADRSIQRFTGCVTGGGGGMVDMVEVYCSRGCGNSGQRLLNRQVSGFGQPVSAMFSDHREASHRTH